MVGKFSPALFDSSHRSSIGKRSHGLNSDARARQFRKIIEKGGESGSIRRMQKMRQQIILRRRIKARWHDGDGRQANGFGKLAKSRYRGGSDIADVRDDGLRIGQFSHRRQGTFPLLQVKLRELSGAP